MKIRRRHNTLIFLEDLRVGNIALTAERATLSFKPTGTICPVTKRLKGTYDLHKTQLQSSTRR